MTHRHVLAAFCLLALSACRSTGVTSDPNGDIVLRLASHTIRLSHEDWKALPDEPGVFARVEQLSSAPPQTGPRIVTIFKQPMTGDRRVGKQVATGEFVELFIIDAGTVTAQVRLDKQGYWVLSRETFAVSSMPGLDTASRRHALTDEEFAAAQQALQRELAATRQLLRTMF